MGAFFFLNDKAVICAKLIKEGNATNKKAVK